MNGNHGFLPGAMRALIVDAVTTDARENQHCRRIPN
jgi:hypothetical protein